MADFEHEQLKSLFDRLAERLDKTAGDTEHLAMLGSLRTAIGKLQKDLNRPHPTRGGGNDTVIQDFLKDWQGTLKDFKEPAGGGGGRASAAGQRGTLLQQYANEQLESTTKSQRGAQERAEKLSNAFGKVKDNLSDFGKNLDGSAAGLAAMAGLNQGVSGKIFSAIDDQVQMYRNIRQSGEASIDSIAGMQAAQKEFMLSYKQLSDAMLQGTDGARQLGLIRFGDVNKKFRDATASVGRFGLTIDDSIAVQGSYLQMLRDQGNLNTMDNGAIVAGMGQLIRSSNITASILGKTREEVLKERENQGQDANFETHLSTLSKEQAEQYREMVNQIKMTRGEGHAQMAKEQIMLGGGVQTTQSAQIAAMDSGFAQLVNQQRQQIAGGGNFDEASFATRDRNLANSVSNDMRRQMAVLGNTESLGSIATQINAANIGARNLTPEKANDGAETDANIINKAGLEESTAKLNIQFQDMAERVLMPLIENLAPKLLELMDGSSNVLAKVTESGWGLAGAIAVAVGGFAALKIGMGLLHGFFMKTMIGGLTRTLGLGAGRGGGAIGGRLLGGLAGQGAARAGGGALAAGLGGTAAVAGVGLAGLLGVGLSANHVKNNANESFMGDKEGEGGFFSSRASGYLGAMGTGAAAGAGIGALGMGVGAVPGAIIGGILGLGGAVIGDMWGKNEAKNRVSPDNRQRAPQTAAGAPASSGAPAVASATNNGRTTPEMVNQRIATLTETGNNHLRLILENNRAQLEVMRQEMAEARNFYAASLRLFEDGNRGLRQIGAVN